MSTQVIKPAFKYRDYLIAKPVIVNHETFLTYCIKWSNYSSRQVGCQIYGWNYKIPPCAPLLKALSYYCYIVGKGNKGKIHIQT